MTATTRNSDRTRRAVLDAATRVLGEKGTGLSLAEVADAAGVSKSGLMHHFPTRDQLFVAMIDDVIERFRGQVFAFLDLSENTPGKLLRAYVRTLCGGDHEAMREYIASPIWVSIAQDQALGAPLLADNERWHRELLADGLDEQLVGIVRRAAEGYAAAYMFQEEDDASLVRARDALLAMTV